MSKLRTVLLTSVAMIAVGAIATDSAIAELAEWLINGAEINAGERLSTKNVGELLLEDDEAPFVGKVAILCSGILKGTIGANGAGTVTELLNLKGEKIGELAGLALLGEGAGSDCVAETGCAEGSATSPFEVYPIGLPLPGTLIKEAGVWLVLETLTKEAGYEILCLVLGLNTEDRCTWAVGETPSVEVINDANGNAEVPAATSLPPFAKCSAAGGKASALFQTDELASFLLESGALLSVS